MVRISINRCLHFWTVAKKISTLVFLLRPLLVCYFSRVPLWEKVAPPRVDAGLRISEMHRWAYASCALGSHSSQGKFLLWVSWWAVALKIHLPNFHNRSLGLTLSCHTLYWCSYLQQCQGHLKQPQLTTLSFAFEALCSFCLLLLLINYLYYRNTEGPYS